MVSDFFIFTRTSFKVTNFKAYTPLFVAVAARRWSTAKLILAIAAAQYHPEDKNDEIRISVDWGK